MDRKERAKPEGNSILTPTAAVILYEERAKQAEANGQSMVANYYRSLLADARRKLNGGICL